MRGRLALFVLLGSALAFLASLYLTWLDSSASAAPDNTPQGLLNLFSEVSYNGWGPYGQAAALVALALATGVAASLLRPQLETRLALAAGGLALLFFAVLNAAELHGNGLVRGAFDGVQIHFGAGSYVGVASAAVALLAAAVVHRDELRRRASFPAVAAFALTLGLLAAFLLPWLHFHVQRPGRVGTENATGYQLSSIGDNLAIFIAAIACFGLPLWTRRTPPGGRLVANLGLAVLVAGSLSTYIHWSYEAWLALGCSLGLVALALVTARDLRISLPPLADTAAAAAGSLLIVSLFLPWEKGFFGNGWAQTDGATAGGLTVVLLVLLLGSGRLVGELAAGAAIYVMGAGFELTRFGSLEYGAPLGFAGAALLLFVTARKLRYVPFDRSRLVRFVPLVACLAFLAIPVAALTDRLSPRLAFDAPWRVYWLGVAAILVALRLLGRWLGGPRSDDEVMFLPFALLALTTLDLIFARRAFGTISWEGWVSVGLCLLLAVLGWMERNSGLDRLRVPGEIWRVDRLPGEN